MGPGRGRALNALLALGLPAAMAAVTALGLAAGYGAWHTDVGRNLELQTIDARFAVRGAEKPWPGVVVVGIDAQTLIDYGQFPLRRKWDAQLTDTLRADGARTIAFDLVFDHASPYPNDDLHLYEAAKRAHGHIVLAGTATDAAGGTFVLGGAQNQRAAGVDVGSPDFPEDPDGSIRHLPSYLMSERLQSFAFAVARTSGVAAATLRSRFDGLSQWIDFPGPAGTTPTYSFAAVLSRSFNPAQVRGRIVVIGATEGYLQDTHNVGGWASQPMSGPEIEADSIATLMEGAPLRSASSALDWLVLALAAALLPLLAWRRVRWPRLVWTGLAAAAAILVAAQIAFDDGTIILIVPTLLALLVSGVASVLIPLALERRELARLRDRFARFDPAVVDAVLDDPGIALRARAMAIGPESVIAGYRIVALLGRGGMGVVYDAIQLTLERPVALKLISPAHADDAEFRTRFVRESHVAAALEHPHVIPVYEAREDAGLLFIAMRLVRGPSLDDVFAAQAPLAPRHAARLVIQIADALGAAHARGLVHRDVKPANVLLHERDHAYLTDFGVTRELGEEGLTAAGERIGTVDYMAPEQCRGERVGPAADIYSLGCVLFEALTGRVPYPAGSEAERMAAHLHDPIPRAGGHWPAVPAALDAVIVRALAKEPGERFISAAAFAAEIGVAAGLTTPADPAPAAPRVPDAPVGPGQATIASG